MCGFLDYFLEDLRLAKYAAISAISWSEKLDACAFMVG